MGKAFQKYDGTSLAVEMPFPFITEYRYIYIKDRKSDGKKYILQVPHLITPGSIPHGMWRTYTGGFHQHETAYIFRHCKMVPTGTNNYI